MFCTFECVLTISVLRDLLFSQAVHDSCGHPKALSAASRLIGYPRHGRPVAIKRAFYCSNRGPGARRGEAACKLRGIAGRGGVVSRFIEGATAI
jgi:hypothetical protein